MATERKYGFAFTRAEMRIIIGLHAMLGMALLSTPEAAMNQLVKVMKEVDTPEGNAACESLAQKYREVVGETGAPGSIHG